MCMHGDPCLPAIKNSNLGSISGPPMLTAAGLTGRPGPVRTAHAAAGL